MAGAVARETLPVADYLALYGAVGEPVRWDASLDQAAAAQPDATFVEVGPGGVLHNMVGRGWKRLARQRMDVPDAGDPAAAKAKATPNKRRA